MEMDKLFTADCDIRHSTQLRHFAQVCFAQLSTPSRRSELQTAGRSAADSGCACVT